MIKDQRAVSVIIPVRNGFSALRRCLHALHHQRGTRHLQIIVVDNDSSEPILPLQEEFPGVLWLSEPKAGSYAARNAGLKHATGEVIAFTDADCIPEDEWVEHGCAAIDGHVTLAGGAIRFLDPADRGLNVYEVLETATSVLGNHQFFIERMGYAVTANLFVDAKVFPRVGPFNDGLKSSGDREWVQRAVRHGELLSYVHKAAVWHPRRSTFGEHVSKRRRIMGGIIDRSRQCGASGREVLREFYQNSVFHPQGLQYGWTVAVTHTALTCLKARVAFFALYIAMKLVSTVEGVRVLAGRPAQRT